LRRIPQLRRVVRAPLFWLAVLYLLVGVIYAQVSPALEKPDEPGHYGYLLYLREHHVVPPLRYSESAGFRGADQDLTRARLMFEFKQPPLYYIVTTGLTSWLPDDPDPDQMLAPNPYVWFSVPKYRSDNRNRFLHPPDMTPLVLGGRLVSLLFGLGNMIASYFLAAQLFSKKSLVPIATAAVAGFHPTFLYIATAVNNDSATTFLGTLVLTVLMYRRRKGDFVWFAVLVGGILGLAASVKVSALVFVPLVGLALLFIHRGFRPAFFRDGVIIVAVTLLVGGWWYARNAVLYADPLGVSTHTAGGAEMGPLLDRLGYSLDSIERTFWGNPSPVFINLIGLDEVLVWWGRISIGLLVLSFVINRQSVRANLPALIVLLSWPVAFLVLLVVYWNQQGPWPFGRLLFPAIAPTALSLLWGWQSVFPLPWRRLVLTLSAGMMIVIGALIPFVSLYPLFHPSREWQAEQVEHPVETVYVDPDTGSPVVRLIGYNLPKPYAMAGTYFPVELCWEPLGQTNVPYTVFVQLLDLSPLDDNRLPTVWGRRETYPGLGNRPTDRWALHQAFCDTVFVRVFPETPTPLGAAIEVGFTDPERKNRLQATDPDPIALAVVGSVPILSSRDLPATTRPARYVLDNAIGLDYTQSLDAMGSSLTLTLTWQSLRPVPYDATMFVHLRGADGNILAQVDRQTLDGRYPTSYWLPGQTITDVVNLLLPPGAPQGPLVLDVGMYTWPSLQRLPIVDTSGAPQRDNVIVIDVPPK
jgi:4-amino-4-deoxy-L-arabinose transferase-like glycosyltransferase